ncbi:hypothetical protein ACHAP5_012048 [Fusarium lateritium]
MIGTYNPSLVSEGSTKWLNDVELIGSDDYDYTSAYFTGDAAYSHHNLYHFASMDTHAIKAYDKVQPNPLMIPFHGDCYNILEKVAAPSVILPNALHATFKSHHHYRPSFCLNYDYGDASSCQDGVWKCVEGMEYLVSSPTDMPHPAIRQLIKLLISNSKLEELSAPDISSPTYSTKSRLDALPTELMTEVLKCLDYDTLCALRQSSRTGARGTSNGFWKNKFFSDMKWILEFFPSTQQLSEMKIDWFKLYKATRAVGKGRHLRKQIAAPGFRNRYRIWQMCERILQDYWPLRLAIGEEFEDPSAVLEGGQYTIVPMLRYPYKVTMNWANISILDTYEAVRNAQPVITVFWSSEGELCAIGVQAVEGEAKKLVTGVNRGLVYSHNDVHIPENSWITKLEIISQEQLDKDDLNKIVRKVVGLRFNFSKGYPIQVGQAEGDVRVTYPPDNHFVVGFRVGWNSGEPISRLGLVYQSFNKAPQDSLRRLQPKQRWNKWGQPVPPEDLEHTGHLWKGGAPPEELTITHGRRILDETEDLMKESLIFGTSDSDLAKITAIGADAQLRGFQVRMDDGTTRSIGKTNAMQYLEIDGRGGERIVFCYATIPYFHEGMRFLTNRGRQLVVGKLGSLERRIPDDGQYPSVHLMGIYCNWKNRNTPGAELRILGGFTRDLSRSLFRPGWMTEDGKGRSFHTMFTPKGSGTVGFVHGQAKGKSQYVLSDIVTKAWFDCSRPISTIKVAMCHGTESSRLPIVSLSFKYADNNTTRSFGPTEFNSPQDTRGCNGNYWCGCSKGSSRDDELEERPHYIQDEWNAKGARLRFIKIWRNKEGALSALQFVTWKKKLSPIWGYNGAVEPIIEEVGRTIHNYKVGLQFYIDGIGRKSGRDDRVVTAIQLLAIPKRFPGGR